MLGLFLFSESSRGERAFEPTGGVTRGSFLRFPSGSLSPRRASLAPAAPQRAGEERALSRWPAARHLAAFGAVRSRGCSFGCLRPSPSTFLPSLSRPPPPLSRLQLNSLAGVRVRLLSSRASASSGSHPALRTPPAPYLPAVAGPVGSRGDARARTRTRRGAERETPRRGVSSIGGGVRGGGGVCVCVCSMVWLVEGRAEAWKRTEEKRKESESPSTRTSNLVRVPGRAERRERGRRPGGVSGIGLRDEWAGDEWREAAAARSLLGVSALVGGALTEAR